MTQLDRSTRITVTLGAAGVVLGLVITAAMWMQSMQSHLASVDRGIHEQTKVQQEIVHSLNRFSVEIAEMRTRVRYLEDEVRNLRKKLESL